MGSGDQRREEDFLLPRKYNLCRLCVQEEGNVGCVLYREQLNAWFWAVSFIFLSVQRKFQKLSVNSELSILSSHAIKNQVLFGYL